VGPHTITASTGVAATQYVNTNLSGYPTPASGAYNLSNANLAGGCFVGAAFAGADMTNANLTRQPHQQQPDRCERAEDGDADGPRLEQDRLSGRLAQ
jgi:uncharacterized protein YjbI with pentapeptide repeats